MANRVFLSGFKITRLAQRMGKARKTIYNWFNSANLNWEIIYDAKECSVKDEIFNNFAEQYANRSLKKIADVLDIKINLHWHVGRHTFISLYYAKTKDLYATKEFAGHTNIRQTLVYTHQNPDEIKDRMKPMDDII